VAAVFVGGGTYQQLKGTLRLDHAIKTMSGAAILAQHPQDDPVQFPRSMVRMPHGARSMVEYNGHVLPFQFVGDVFVPPKIYWWPTSSNAGDVVFRIVVMVYRPDDTSFNITSALISPVPVQAGKESGGIVTVASGLSPTVLPPMDNLQYFLALGREGADGNDTYLDDILIGHAYTDLVIP
jgi:hypothetical protein